ncbi:tripartite tricarboxylate transporter permease [Rhodoferax sp.]|uniref:tripartite tricarboxylate transporter permease n=3 Tax=Rhodoferax sp. TaxID=50421 RepID=UPI00271F4358|nr:tripartite tricarboxylate transporter permease [Rhodoferax sp.]MDO9143732.1 tripartite tricarboxylate transporter permease [Rhodoferax sp.]
MEILRYLIDALTPFNLMLALAGVTLGTIIGALPGLSATMAVAILVPFTFAMAPASGLIALGAIYTGAIYGGAFSAILVNTPGTPSSIATTFDGYPMAKRGDGGLAVTLATIASVFGGLVGATILILLAPPLANVALAFGPTEYFWLAIFGLTLISALSVGNTLKGLIGACIGLLLSTIGVAVVGGDVRYTMNSQILLGGIDITSALIGLYCIPVVIDLVASKAPHLSVLEDARGYRLPEALRISWASKFNMLRSSLIGTVVGILPGAGGSIAGLIAYSEARRASRHPERFGTGEPNGIIATEASNNATVGGGFIPTLVLGIPGTPPDAIILGALLVQGLKIGPSLFNEQGNVVYTFMFGLLIATVLMLPVGLLLGRYAYKSIVRIPKSLLVPTVAFLTILGSFAIHSNPHDMQMMFVLGVLAWILQRYGFAPSPIVLGLVLGQIAEQGFVQSYMIGNATNALTAMFFGRPISMAIIAFSLLTLFYPLLTSLFSRRRKAPLVEATDTVVKAQKAVQTVYRDVPAIAFGAVFVVIGVLAYLQIKDMSAMGSVFPGTLSSVLVLLSLMLITFQVGRPKAPGKVEEPGAVKPSTVRRFAIVVAMAVWALLLPSIGFFVTSLIAFLVLTVIATFDRPSSREVALYAVSAVVIVGSFYLLMDQVLGLRMPAGLLF